MLLIMPIQFRKILNHLKTGVFILSKVIYMGFGLWI